MRHLQQLRYIDAVARIGSIRRAAETLAITSTALNRRILAIEEDLGTPVFERLPKGVRLSAAGELYIHHVRRQLSDMERVKSQIADLSGERRGHVSIVCGQALMSSFLPTMVSSYRERHPGVSFSVFVAGRQQAAERLIDFSADLSVIFEPEASTNVQVLVEVRQQLHALVAVQHPLADRQELKLSECVQYPMALSSQRTGVRFLLDRASARRDLSLPVVLESDNDAFLHQCLRNEQMIAFQIPVAFAAEGPAAGIKAIPVATRDLPPGALQLSQQRGRSLPVAAARFASFVTDGLRLHPSACGELEHAAS